MGVGLLMEDFFENDPSNSMVEKYREYARKNGYGELSNYSNEELTHYIGSQLEQGGETAKSIGEKYNAPDFTEAYLNVKNRPRPEQGYFDELGSGFKSAGAGLMGMFPAAAGLATGKLGFDRAEEWFM